MKDEKKDDLYMGENNSVPEMESSDRITKRIAITQETYKKLKIKTIEMEIDEDGKFTPETLGKAIDFLINENEELKKYKIDFQQRFLAQNKAMAKSSTIGKPADC